jgi:hypothetical protein
MLVFEGSQTAHSSFAGQGQLQRLFRAERWTGVHVRRNLQIEEQNSSSVPDLYCSCFVASGTEIQKFCHFFSFTALIFYKKK